MLDVDVGTHAIGHLAALGDDQAAVDVGESQGSVACGEINLCLGQEHTVVFGINAACDVEGRVGSMILLELEQAYTFVEYKSPVGGIELKTFVVVGYGQLEFFLVLAGNGSHLIGIDDKRVALDAKRGILLGSLEILEIEFGHSAIEIGLGQVGLGRNYLIEVLYREHIIFKVERILPYAQHLLGVDLRNGNRRCP